MKINRFYILFALSTIVGGWCIIKDNPYITAIVLSIGFLVYLFAVAYITENLNETEERFIEKIKNNF